MIRLSSSEILTVDVQQIHVRVAVVYVIVIEGEQYRLDRLGFALDAPSLFHADPLHYFQQLIGLPVASAHDGGGGWDTVPLVGEGYERAVRICLSDDAVKQHGFPASIGPGDGEWRSRGRVPSKVFPVNVCSQVDEHVVSPFVFGYQSTSSMSSPSSESASLLSGWWSMSWSSSMSLISSPAVCGSVPWLSSLESSSSDTSP